MSERRLFCPWALTPEGWCRDTVLAIDASGFIQSVDSGAASADAERLGGPVLPGMTNVHSHAHQRLIAGLTGRRDRGEDSFWSWREQMYRAIALLQPDDLETLAAWLYVELLEGGYTSIGEFHYPHHLGGGQALDSARALLAAAGHAGCGLTLLPVWYRYGGFGRQPAAEHQASFLLEPDAFSNLLQRLVQEVQGDALFRLGMAPHSLRAVDARDLPELCSAFPDLPVHIHISEQPGEVSACREAHGIGPVGLLAGEVDLDRRWCLIHATHAERSERERMLAADVVVGLCPTTEADLGDGLFAADEWFAAKGRFAVGSDSNLITTAASELRLLEWGQRLRGHQRNVLVDGSAHVGRTLWQRAAAGGAEALGQPAGVIAPGQRADLVVLDPGHPLLDGLSPDQCLDSFIMAEQPGMIDAVIVAGHRRVEHGRHPAREELGAAFSRLRRRLADQIQV